MHEEDAVTAARRLVADYRDRKRPVPGFGHPIHTGRDPRAEKLLSYIDEGSAALSAARAVEVAR